MWQIFWILMIFIAIIIYLNNQSNNISSSSESRYTYPFVTKAPRDIYYPTVLSPWNMSTIGPDFSRRTFEIGE